MTLEAWGRDNLPLLERLMGDPRMTKHLGGPESPQKLRERHDEQVYEVGWMVVPELQGRGIALAATARAIELARRDGKHRHLHAFPNVENAPSNAICRKLGFELLATCEFEFPKGHFMTCNDWRLDLGA